MFGVRGNAALQSVNSRMNPPTGPMIGPNSAAAVNARVRKQYGESPVNRTRGLADLARRDRQMAAARRTQGFGAAGIGASNSANKAVPSGMFGARANVAFQDVNRRMAGPSGMFGARGNAMLQDVNRRMAAKSGGGLGGVNTGMMHGPNLPPVGKKGILSGLSTMTRRTKVGIGLGLGVAAGVAMNRRGEGVSPGRQSNARY
jgi:hypothetical protein